MAEGQHGERRNFQLTPTAHVIQSGFDVFRFQGVEHRPVFAAVAQRQRLVPLNDGNGPGIEPRGQHGAHLSPTQALGFAEASAVDGSVGCKAVGQPEKQFAVLRRQVDESVIRQKFHQPMLPQQGQEFSCSRFGIFGQFEFSVRLDAAKYTEHVIPSGRFDGEWRLALHDLHQLRAGFSFKSDAVCLQRFAVQCRRVDQYLHDSPPKTERPGLDPASVV